MRHSFPRMWRPMWAIASPPIPSRPTARPISLWKLARLDSSSSMHFGSDCEQLQERVWSETRSCNILSGSASLCPEIRADKRRSGLVKSPVLDKIGPVGRKEFDLHIGLFGASHSNRQQGVTAAVGHIPQERHSII